LNINAIHDDFFIGYGDDLYDDCDDLDDVLENDFYGVFFLHGDVYAYDHIDALESYL
jgi:hypothetical protein